MKSVNFIPLRSVQTNTASPGVELRGGAAPQVAIHDSYSASSEKEQRKPDPTPAAWRMMPPLIQESILNRLTSVDQAKLCIADKDIYVLSAGLDLAMHEEKKYSDLVADANDLVARTFKLAFLAKNASDPFTLVQPWRDLAGEIRRLQPVLSAPPGDARRRSLAKSAAVKLGLRSESALMNAHTCIRNALFKHGAVLNERF